MILDLILGVLKIIIEILLSPLTVLNVAIDFIGSIPVVMSFIQVVAYVLPWSNILPIIILLFAIFGFRIVISVILLVKRFF